MSQPLSRVLVVGPTGGIGRRGRDPASAIVTILAGYANLADVTDADLDAWDDELDIVSACGDLANATEDLRDSGDFYTSGFELPEYDDFVRQSDQITAERDESKAVRVLRHDQLALARLQRQVSDR